MAGVLRIDNLNYRATLGDVRRVFKECGVTPADIHLGAHSNGKANGVAFAVFTNRKDAEDGLCADGFICRDSRINVRSSNPKEFDRMFPGKPMLSNNHNQKNYNRGSGAGVEDRLTNVVKVDHINYNASPSEIRRFFKDHDARPEDIHLVLQPNSTKHNGCAFLIFSTPSEAVNALKLDGAIFFDKRLIVTGSNPKEFDRNFPRVPMITKGAVRGRGGRGRSTGPGMNNNSMSRSSIGSSDGRSDRFNNNSSRGRGRGGGAVRGGRGGGGLKQYK